MNHKIIRAVTVSLSVGFFRELIPYLRENGDEVIALSSPGNEMEELNKSGVCTIEIPMERHISPVRDLAALIRIVKVFRKEKPDMVHSMTPKAGLLCMMAAWLTRVPVRVHTFTGLVWPTAKGIQRRILMFTDWLTCACATHIIPEGKGVMDDLQKYITKKPMRVLGYGNVRGVDMTRFSRRPDIMDKASLIRREDAFTFLFVGRIVGDKGVNELVKAFEKLYQENAKIRLIMVGAYEEELDPLRIETKNAINSMDSIVTTGPKHGDDLVAYYAASDCFVLPSYREGFPNTVLEAGAMGLPSIVTDINGSREIVEHGKNGLVVPAKNLDALYQAMKQIIENRVLSKTLAQNSRPMIESRFEQGYVRQCLLSFYKEILR